MAWTVLWAAMAMAMAMAGVALGQGPGVPYRVSNVEQGERLVPAGTHSYLAEWNGRVLFISDGEGSVLAEFDPRAQAGRVVVASRDGLELLGMVEGRALVVRRDRLDGAAMEAVEPATGAVTRLAGLSGVEEGGQPGDVWPVRGGLVLRWNGPSGGVRWWFSDGTADGTFTVQAPALLTRSRSVEVGAKVVYQQWDGLWAWDPRAGSAERIVEEAGLGWFNGGVRTPDGREIVLNNERLIETDATAAGTRVIAEGVDSWGPPLLVGDRVLTWTRDRVTSYDRRTGAALSSLEIPGSPERKAIGVGDGVLLVDLEYGVGVRARWTDGVEVGEAVVLSDAPSWMAAVSGDGGSPAFVRVEESQGRAAAYRTDGTVAGTARVPDWGAGPEFYDGTVPVIEGRAYFARPDDGNPWVIGDDGVERRVMELARRKPVGLGGCIPLGVADGRAWYELSATSGPDWTMWSTGGDAGDLAASPCTACGPYWWTWLEDPAGGGVFAVVDDAGRRKLLRAAGPGREPQVLAEWAQGGSGGGFALASGGGRWIVASDREAIVTDGSPAGWRRWELSSEVRYGVQTRAAWLGAGFVVWTRDLSTGAVRFWSVADASVRDLGALDGWQEPFVMGGRVFKARYSTAELRYELWASDGSRPMELVASSRDLEFPGYIGEHEGRGYFYGPTADGAGFGVWVGEAADATLGALRFVSVVPGEAREWHFLGDRLVAGLGVSEGRIVSLDLGTGRLEVLFERPSRLVAVGSPAGGEGRAVVHTWCATGEEEWWVTDGTAAGARRVPGAAGVARADGRLVGGRFIFTAETEGLGPQVYAANLCAGDFDGDGVLEARDYLGFVGAFEGGVASGDFDGDGFVDLFDYAGFVEAYEAGC